MDLRPLHLPHGTTACAAALTAVAACAALFGAATATAWRLSLGLAAVCVAGITFAIVVASLRERGMRAAREERRRFARELHDGLAQELAFLVTQAKILARMSRETEGLGQLEAAAQRALDETRLAIAGLTANGSITLADAVEAAAEEVAHREGAQVHLELDRSVAAPDPVRDEIVRIVREAATNAIRHGRADAVRIGLSGAEGIHLEIVDDGVGFEPGRVRNGGGNFGLISMTERARAVGGRLEVVSEPGSGTRVEVTVP